MFHHKNIILRFSARASHPASVVCLVKVIVLVPSGGPGCRLSRDNALRVVPFAGEHLITEVILNLNLESVPVEQDQTLIKPPVVQNSAQRLKQTRSVWSHYCHYFLFNSRNHQNTEKWNKYSEFEFSYFYFCVSRESILTLSSFKRIHSSESWCDMTANKNSIYDSLEMLCGAEWPTKKLYWSVLTGSL